MSRPPRIEVPFGYYHVNSRGNNKQEIFDDVLREFFRFELTLVARQFDWSVYAWAMMTNHFHLVLQIGEKGLSDGMQRLNYTLARASNARFGRINHCVGDRFYSTHIENDDHLFRSIRYALWNPARAGIGAHPAECNWTSFQASAGLTWVTEPLATWRLLRRFSRTPAAAQEAFRAFVSDGSERCLAPWQDGVGILR